MKNNKKGFTLAELLIVIAIIAILIAIAIPSFSASLYNARLQTDHANIRNAYAIYKTAEMTDILDDGSATGVPAASFGTGPYYFQKDGTMKTTTDNAYTCQVTPKAPSECIASVGCGYTAGASAATNHKEGAKISINYTAGSGGASGTWKFSLS